MNLRPQQLKVRTLMEEGEDVVGLSDMSAIGNVCGLRDGRASCERL